MKALLIISILFMVPAVSADDQVKLLSPPASAPIFMKRISDIATLLAQPAVSQGRDRKSNFPRDVAFQRGIQRLIDEGLIHGKTLIISDTGHDIPMAAQLLKNPLASQIAFYLPKKLGHSSPTIGTRLKEQTWDWKIDFAKQSATADVFFIGLEYHRENYGKPYYLAPTEKFPTEQDLLKQGVVKVIYLYEVFFGGKEEQKISKDLREYFKQFKRIRVETYATDCQRIPDC